MKRTFTNIKFMTKYILKYAKEFFPVTIVSAMFQAFNVSLEIVGVKYLLDSIFLGQDIKKFVIDISLFALSTLICKLFFSWTNYFYPLLTMRISFGISKELMNKSQKLDYRAFDDPKYYDTYTRALMDADGTLRGLISAYIAIFSNIISVSTIIGILINMGIEYILIALLNVTVSYIIMVIQNKWQYQFDMSTTRHNRATQYFKGLFFDSSSAKEIRIFNMGSHFIKKYNDVAKKLYSDTKKFKRKYLSPNYIGDLITFISLFFTMYFAGSNIILTGSSIGIFMAAINAVNSLSDQLFSLLSQLPHIINQARYIENVRQVIETNDPIENNIDCGNIQLPMEKNYKIEFINVNFSYPNTDNLVLKNMSFTIEKGQRVAIVGENGAGKSTIFKLLLRLYDPTSGEIKINGANIKQYEISSLRRAFSTVFQDFKIYATTVIENIDFSENPDVSHAKQCLENVQLLDKILKEENQLESKISRMFDEKGIVFSGGENQKLAIARAYAKESGIILLDEPSSSLDPLSEYNLINILKSTIAKQTAVIISHRLIICKSFDNIMLIKNGCVKEMGNHQQLMEMQGIYYSMFTKQNEEG